MVKFYFALIWCHLVTLLLHDDSDQPTSYQFRGHVPPDTDHLYIMVTSATNLN